MISNAILITKCPCMFRFYSLILSVSFEPLHNMLVLFSEFPPSFLTSFWSSGCHLFKF